MTATAERNKILIVDDDQDFRSLLEDYLSDSGFSVTVAGSGAEALWVLSQEKPDLVILDLTMPEMPGTHVCRLIKSDPALTDVIVFILSGRADLKTKLECFQMGAEEFLVKPIELAELAARMKSFLTFAVRHSSKRSADQTMTIEVTQESVEESSSGGVTNALDVQPLRNVEKSSYGSYRVERLVGRGGMGQVYKAYDEQLDRFVALKVLAKEWTDSAEFVARFRREAKLIAAINHPGIAQIYSLGQDQGEYYFALLWCPGGSLRDLIRNETRIGLLKAVDILLQCANALAAAWQKGVVHRDVKPSNIMFDENQQIKLVDFGIAHSESMSSHLTIAQEILGSPAYMSPEQGRAQKVDHRADIYALGMTFYQMMCGELPFSASNPVQWMIKHATEPFPSYQKVEGKIPLRAYRIIEKMTRKDLADRYADYSDLIQDLETVQSELFLEQQFKVPSPTRVASVPSIQGNQLFDVLARILQKKHSGILKANWGPLEKKFLIRQGDIVLFESPQREENVWEKLSERGILEFNQIPQNSSLEVVLNQLLFQHQLTLDDFTSCYRQVMKTAFLEIFRWPVVEVEFTEAEIAQDSFCKCSVLALAMEGIRNYSDYESIRHEVPKNGFIFRTSKFDAVFSALELPVTESFLASRIEGGAITLEVLQLLTGFPIEQITRFVYALNGFEAIEFRAPETRKTRGRTDKDASRENENLTPAV